MYYILFIMGVVWLIITLLRRPKARLFIQTKVTPLLTKSVQQIRQAKDRILSHPRTKRRAILILAGIGLLVLALIFR